MPTAIVAWFSATRGFGFLQPVNGGPEIFVHQTAVDKAGLDTLQRGQRVEFQIGLEQGKQVAVDLELL